MPINVAVIGAGSWGTTVAALAAVNAPTILWARRPELAAQINDAHINGEYLANFMLPEQLQATSTLKDAVSHADVLVMAVPSHGYRDVAAEAAPYVRPWVPVVSLTKGIERSSRKRMSEVTSDEMPGHPVAVLTGPNLAKEILGGQPAASVVAIDDEVIAAELQRIFSRPSLRIYTNPDVVGCEVGGVVKNVIAIASGMAVLKAEIVKRDAFIGAQSQRITFADGGVGEVGIENRGLNRRGLAFAAGKPYEGYVWLRADKPVETETPETKEMQPPMQTA